MKRGAYRAILVVLIVVTLGFIFSNSSKTGPQSSKDSNRAATIVAQTFVRGFDQMTEEQKETEIRKISPPLREAAHFLEFFALGFFVFLLLNSFDGVLKEWYFSALIALSACFLAAISDEFLQTFVDGRAAEWLDVGIDSLGAAVGSTCAFAATVAFRRIFNRRK